MPASSSIDRRTILLLALAILTGVLLRAWRASGLDVFEDGYHHWYIALGLRDSGVLQDNMSGMTGGNWLPLYYYAAAGTFILTGSTSIFVLKGLGILCSVVTTLFVFLIGERWKKNAGLIAAFFFALNPLDIILSSMSLPDSMALALLTAALYLLMFHSGNRARLMTAGMLLAAAAATRYEVWAMLPLLFFFVILGKDEGRLPLSWRVGAFVPSLVFALSWLAFNSMQGPLLGTIFGQTVLQPEIIAERTGLGGPQRAGLFWLLYGANEAVLLVLAAAFYIFSWKRREKLPRGLPMLSAIFLMFILMLTVLVATGLMVGSYRYLSYTVVTVVLVASLQVEHISLSRGLPVKRAVPRGWHAAATASLAMLLLIPSMQYSFVSVDASSTLNEPQVRAGMWLRDHVTSGDGQVLVDSPIAAYYSGLPPDRIVGSAVLPRNDTKAREFVLQKIGYVVFLDHPFFWVTHAFPELRQGRSVGNFRFEYTPNDWRVAFGAHPTYIYKVAQNESTFPATGNLSMRFYSSTAPGNGKISVLEKGAVLVDRENETVGEGAGFGTPVLNWSGVTYFSRNAKTTFSERGCSKRFLLDSVETGVLHRTSFVTVPPAGEVEVKYRVNGSVLSIDVALTNLPRNATLMMLNEQAGMRYWRYADFAGSDMNVDFSWRMVTGWYNYLLDSDGRGFRVDYTPEFYNGTTLYLGRETAPEGFDWAGLDYGLDLSAFNGTKFAYDIHLVGG